MRKGKQTQGSEERQDSAEIKLVHVEMDQSRIEMEIDRHVKHIHWLIRKLRPTDRQKYYDGLLSHILSEPLDEPKNRAQQRFPPQRDYSKLSTHELQLIRELSAKMEELYRTMES